MNTNYDNIERCIMYHVCVDALSKDCKATGFESKPSRFSMLKTITRLRPSPIPTKGRAKNPSIGRRAYLVPRNYGCNLDCDQPICTQLQKCRGGTEEVIRPPPPPGPSRCRHCPAIYGRNSV